MNPIIELDLDTPHYKREEAMNLLKVKLQEYKKDKYQIVIIIHGYGSSGVGGVIKKNVQTFLKTQKEKGVIKTVLFGERCDIFNADFRTLKSKYPHLEAYQENEGVTIVEL